jgi:hypothetical protein
MDDIKKIGAVFDPYKAIDLNLIAEKTREDSKSQDLESEQVVNEFYTHLNAIFISCWNKPREQADIDSYKKQLMGAIRDNNLVSTERMELALKKARAYPVNEKTNFPLIGQVIAWMKQSFSDLGLPEVEDAYKISLRLNEKFNDREKIESEFNKNTLMIIDHVLKQIGTTTYRAMTSIDSKSVFKRYYELAVEQLRNEDLKDIQKALSDKKEETKELKKQKDIVKQEYKELKSPISALERMKQLLK